MRAGDSLSQVDGRVGFWGDANRTVFGKFSVGGTDALQIELCSSRGYSIFLIADYTGLSFITNVTGENVTIGRVNWS